jgi:hypothetical protein
MDPRVDSQTGYSSGGHGTQHTAGSAAGPHSSNLANKMDPRIDSSTGYSSGGVGTGATGSTHHPHASHGIGGTGGYDSASHPSTGPAPHTAGPHKSDILNKIDPRVDSDLDGSKTLGKDKTYSGSGSTV